MGYWDIRTTREVEAERDTSEPYPERASAVGGKTPPPRRTAAGKRSGEPPDDYLKRLVRYIPAETIAAYIALDNLMKVQDKIPKAPLEWGVLGLMLIYTFFHMKRVRHVSSTSQVLISVGAFLAWAAGNGGPFDSLSFWSPAFGSAAVILATLAIPLIEPDSLRPPRGNR